jgi:serine/threonine-protein kinase RsbW
VIRLDLLAILEHRDIALRTVSAACKLVTRSPHGRAWNEFQIHVVSALGEAFNNIVLHGYEGRADGLIQLQIEPQAGRLRIEVRDWGKGFDPHSVPPPDLDGLPESGLGLFIMRAFMDVEYTAGQPNVLTLTKSLDDLSEPDDIDHLDSDGDGGA